MLYKSVRHVRHFRLPPPDEWSSSSATVFVLPIRLMLFKTVPSVADVMLLIFSRRKWKLMFSFDTAMITWEFICLQVYLSQTENQSRPWEKLCHFFFSKSTDWRLHSFPPLDLRTLVRSISASLPTHPFGQSKYARFHFPLVLIPLFHPPLAVLLDFLDSFTALLLWREPTQSIFFCSCHRVFVACTV